MQRMERIPGGREVAHLAELRLGIELALQFGDPLGPEFDICCGHGGYVATIACARTSAKWLAFEGRLAGGSERRTQELR